MRRWLLIVLAFLMLLPVQAASQSFVVRRPIISTGGISCNASTDYAGYQGSTTGGLNTVLDRVYITRWQATAPSGCSNGNLASGFLKEGNANGFARVCIWNSNGSTPSSGGSFVGCTGSINLNQTNTWFSGSLSGAITIGNYYWVGFVSANSIFQYLYTAASGNTYFQVISGSYNNPENITDINTGTWTGATRSIDCYITIGP